MLLAAALLAGCGGESARPAASPPPAGSAASPPPAGAAVPRGCEKAKPETVITEPIAGLVAPLTPVQFEAAEKTGSAIRARGFVALEPGAFVAEFRARTDVQLLFSENEGFDAEVLVAAGATQTFYKLTQACDGGSEVVAVVTERL